MQLPLAAALDVECDYQRELGAVGDYARGWPLHGKARAAVSWQ